MADSPQKKIQLIPCSQDLSRVPADEKGKFCQACQLHIGDFQDRKLNPHNLPHCGTFRSSQVEVLKKTYPLVHVKLSSAWKRRIISLVASLGLSSLFLKAKPHFSKEITESQMHVWEWEDDRKDTYTLMGTVRAEEDGRALENAIITLKMGEQILGQAFTDSLGRFQMEAPRDTADAQKWMLEVEYLGAKFIHTEIQTRHQNLHIQIRSDVYLDPVEIPAVSEKVITGRIMIGVPIIRQSIDRAFIPSLNQFDPLKAYKKYGPHGQ